MVDTPTFAEYKQYIDSLSTWLTSTNINIQEFLQSVNKQRALLIIKVCQKKNLLVRVIEWNKIHYSIQKQDS